MICVQEEAALRSSSISHAQERFVSHASAANMLLFLLLSIGSLPAPHVYRCWSVRHRAHGRFCGERDNTSVSVLGNFILLNNSIMSALSLYRVLRKPLEGARGLWLEYPSTRRATCRQPLRREMKLCRG